MNDFFSVTSSLHQYRVVRVFEYLVIIVLRSEFSLQSFFTSPVSSVAIQRLPKLYCKDNYRNEATFREWFREFRYYQQLTVSIYSSRKLGREYSIAKGKKLLASGATSTSELRATCPAFASSSRSPVLLYFFYISFV